MEHLLFLPDADAPHELAAYASMLVLRSTWGTPQDLTDFIEPKTPWLGFEHNSVPHCRLKSYPSKAGYNEMSIWNGDLQRSKPEFSGLPGEAVGEHVAGFLQAWLYFNFLESFIGKKIETTFLVRNDEHGIPCLYSRDLHFCLQARVFEIRLLGSNDAKSAVSANTQLLIRTVHKWISRFTHWSHDSFRPKLDGKYPGFMDRIEKCMPAIIRLAETIEQTRSYALPYCKTMGNLSWYYPFNTAEHRKTALGALGWCPFQVKLLEDSANHSTIDWIVATEMSQNPVGHEKCQSQACARNDIDVSRYVQAHVCESGRCEKRMLETRKVIDVLRTDQIPVIEVIRHDNSLQVTVVAQSKNYPGDYIAFSHVWADGIGGTTQAGLNECQFQRLVKLCSSFGDDMSTVRFWLDSLCIPKPDVDEEAFMKALVGIRDVYINAAHTLILDKLIEQCSTSSTTEQLYAHIYLSAWMQRMWTYEEAVLSKEIVFTVKDGFRVYRPEEMPSMRRTVSVVWQSLAAQLYRLRVPRHRLNIGHVSRAFRYRLTNVPEEEFLSVSGILALDTRHLMKFDRDIEERVKHFWLMLRWIPFDIIFLDCPKLETHGFRWAPRTMMYPSQNALDTEVEGRKSECTKSGLVGEYLVLFLDRTLTGTLGSVDFRRSISYVLAEGSTSGYGYHDKNHDSVLRIYCTDIWPNLPSGTCFNAIAMSNEFHRAPREGQWVAAAALLSQPLVDEEYAADRTGHSVSTNSKQSVPSAVPSTTISQFGFVGRVIVERLQKTELGSRGKTVMFEGPRKVVIGARARWSAAKICVT